MLMLTFIVKLVGPRIIKS